MSDIISNVLSHAFADELDSALSRIKHCLDQLTDEQIWWRPRSDMNSIGNLVLHLNGNVRQLIISTVGGEPDDRDRPAEFAARNVIPKSVLLEQLGKTIESAKSVISRASLEELCRVRRIREFDWSGLQAIVRSVAHFRGHTQEIIHQTRTILGEQYRFAGQR
ncbi:MAG TPA: DUF1572 family protein [Gemmata sp.]|jgi:hypothetical protein|nr:DUF1572 family protein [Gemmata sp.]